MFKYEGFQVNVTPDFGGSPVGAPTLYEANINWTPAMPVTLTVGYSKPWLTLQDSMSSNDFLFLARPSIVGIARNIAAGDARASAGVRLQGERWFAAGYLTGAPYGSQRAALAQHSLRRRLRRGELGHHRRAAPLYPRGRRLRQPAPQAPLLAAHRRLRPPACTADRRASTPSA